MALELPAEWALVAVNKYLPGPYLSVVSDQWEDLVRSVLPAHVNTAINQFLEHNASAHAKNLPLMNPFDVVLIILVYLVVIFGGMLVMKAFEPLNVKYFSMLHNLFLVLLSGYMMVEVLHQALINGYSLFGNASDETAQGWPMAKIIWVFYVSKIVEFIDTVIMVLKKNNRQVSFLHVYHHVTIFAIWWLVTYTAPGGEAYYSAALNSFIHVVMYSYYFASTLKIQLFKNKFLITGMQMTQFLTMMIQSAYDTYTDSPYNKLTTQILFYYMITLLALFGNFLIQNQKPKKTQGESKKEQ